MNNDFYEEEVTEDLSELYNKKGYEPFEEKEFRLNLTMEQENFIDEIARRYDLKFHAAWEMLWNDCFKILKVVEKYKDI